MGNLHPHDSSSIDAAIVGMSHMRSPAPLVIGVGNFGSYDAPASASRYITCYLSPYALTMLDPDEIAQVPMDETYDGKSLEPRFLPAPIPNLLALGCDSIAAGAKGNIPPCPPEWILDAVGLVARGHAARVTVPEHLPYRWGGHLIRMDRSWVHDGTGSATLRPTLRVEKDVVVFTSLAPGIDVSQIESVLEKHDDFAGMAKESPAPGELIRLVVRVRRGRDPRVLARYALEEIRSRIHFSFLHIRQKDGARGVDFDPVVEGPVAYLERWVRWRKRIVAGAATLRAERCRKEIARIDVLVLAIKSKDRLVRALQAAKSREDLHERIKGILRCSDEDARMVREIQFQRLAFLEVRELQDKRARLVKDALANDAVAAKPGPRMLADAAAAVEALALTKKIADEARRGAPKPREGKGKRSRRA
jgi:DNA gyrase/topoisomerase IV subunit A